MGRGQGRNGYNHVLAAIADAIHANSTYKGSGKASKGGGAKGQWQQQDGRNCPSCGDYNFGFRMFCRQCGTRLPPAQAAGDSAKGRAANKGGGKGTGAPSVWGGKGSSEGAASAAMPGAPAAPQPPVAAKTGGTGDEEEARDPTERVREIRGEEEKLRRARGQFSEHNPRMVAAIDAELEQLSAEREKLQPLEVNLQAAAGRTANARASLAKAKERKTQVAKILRAQIEAYKTAEKEVAEAEAKLQAAEAAATAKRTEAKVTGVQEAVELLQQTAATKCGDSVAAQVAAALQQIANLLGAVAAATTGDADTDDGGGGRITEATEQATEATGGGADGKGRGHHAVFTVCGDSGSKHRRTLPLPQEPAALVGVVANATTDERVGDGNGEQFAGGSVDGEVCMGNGASGTDDGDDLLVQAAAALGDDDSQL